MGGHGPESPAHLRHSLERGSRTPRRSVEVVGQQETALTLVGRPLEPEPPPTRSTKIGGLPTIHTGPSDEGNQTTVFLATFVRVAARITTRWKAPSQPAKDLSLTWAPECDVPKRPKRRTSFLFERPGGGAQRLPEPYGEPTTCGRLQPPETSVPIVYSSGEPLSLLSARVRHKTLERAAVRYHSDARWAFTEPMENQQLTVVSGPAEQPLFPTCSARGRRSSRPNVSLAVR